MCCDDRLNRQLKADIRGSRGEWPLSAHVGHSGGPMSVPQAERVLPRGHRSVGWQQWAESRWGGWLPLPASECQSVEAVAASTSKKEPPTMEINTIGLDLAKSIFQVHAIDAAGTAVVRKALRRAQVVPFFAKLPRCLIGMEACGTSHHWARELARLGHEVRLMPPAYVKPYVKRGKNDAMDAEAICEAVTRPTMRFVVMKSAEQQAALSLHRTRNLLVKQRTQLVNMIRGLLAEFG